MQIQLPGQFAVVTHEGGSPPGTWIHRLLPVTASGTQMQFVFRPNEQLKGGCETGQRSLFVKLGVQGVETTGAADTRATDPTIMGTA